MTQIFGIVSPLAISILSGFLFFIAIYFSFERLYQNVWSKLKITSKQTYDVYQDMFYIKKTEKGVIIEQCCVSGGVLLMCLYMFSGSPIFGLIVGVGAFFLCWKLPLFYLEKIVRPRRTKIFSDQMIDGLTLMGNAMKSGMNLSQAFKICVDELEGPITQEFGLILDKNRIGQSVEEGLEDLAARLPSEDVVMFATSVNILKETGGNMTETFGTITKTIRERIKLQNKIDALTAQGMTSAMVVSALPWGLLGILYLIDPVLMTPMLVTIQGWVILMGVLFLEGIGFIVIKKMVTIRV